MKPEQDKPANLNPAEAGNAAKQAVPPASGDIGPFPYVVAMMSVMPGLGVLLGPVAVLWGLACLKRGGKPVAIIGALGFCSQSLFFSFLFRKFF